MATGIGSTYAKDTYISNTCALGTWIKCADVRGIYIKGICAKGTFVGDIITLVGLEVNDCCL